MYGVRSQVGSRFAAALSAVVAFASMGAVALPAVAAPLVTTVNTVSTTHDSPGASANWAGYAVSKPFAGDSSFSHAIVDFVMPSVTCTSQTAIAAFWAGLGGFSDRQLVQAGAQAECVNGNKVYFLWSEQLPAFEKQWTSVNPGDHVHVDVVYTGGGSYKIIANIKKAAGGTWNGERDFSGGSTPKSAECIAERPSDANGNLFNLANFHTFAFTAKDGCDVTDATRGGGSKTYHLDQPLGSNVHQLKMENNRGRVLTQPSAPKPSAPAITFKWLAYS